MDCEICGRSGASRHHIFTRGAWGKRAEKPENVLHLCFPHHMAFHDLGRETAAAIYNLTERVRIAEGAVKGVSESV